MYNESDCIENSLFFFTFPTGVKKQTTFTTSLFSLTPVRTLVSSWNRISHKQSLYRNTATQTLKEKTASHQLK